jgi:hypothetical protein
MLKHLKTLLVDFARFFRADFHLASYIYTVAVAALSILFVYGTEWGALIARNRIPTANTIVNNILMFVVVYFLIAVPTALLRGEFGKLRKAAFFAKGLLLMCLIGFADAFSWGELLDLEGRTASEQSYIFKTLWRMRNVMFVLPVLMLLRLTVDRDVKGLYGICVGNHHVKAYLCLYVVVLPILAVVSFTPDFQTYYPMYKPWNFEHAFGRPVWLNTVIFEAVYISDFLMVEMIFRGALVIGMASLLGRSAVLPMIVVYVALHFGKPVMETVSALFGGYFLGALAFQTRHIWGGVIIHMGIALIIELLRFGQEYL